MKRTLLTAISVILAIVSVFGIYASSTGLNDIDAIMLYKNKQKASIIQNIDLIEESVEELDRLAAERADDELAFAEGTAAQTEGGKQLDAGQAQYDAGKAQYDSGKAKYDKGEAEYAAAKAQYDQKQNEYEHACEALDEAEAQLEAAKAERDAGQAKLDAATPAYNALKGIGSVSGVAADLLAQNYGYSSASAAISEYEAGQAQLAEANVQIASAEQQIADGKAQLADAKTQLDAAKKQLDAARAELDSAKGQLDTAKSQLDSAKSQLASGKKELQEKSDAMEDALNDLKNYDDAQVIVDTGIAALLANDAIAEKVIDPDDYHEVLEVAREYIEEDTENVSAELEVRQQLYSYLRLVSIVCFAAGIVCFIAAFSPSLGKLKLAVGAALISAAVSVGINVYGFTNNYTEFAYCLEDGSGSGKIQLIATLALAVLSLLVAVLSVVCLRAYKIGLGIISADEDEDYVGDEDYDDLDDDVEAIEMGVAPEELGKAEAPEAPEEEPAPVKPEKPEKSKKQAKPEKPAKAEAPETPAVAAAPAGSWTCSCGAVSGGNFCGKCGAKKPEVTVKPVVSDKERKLKAENSQLKTDLENMEYEKARREYEAARKKFEEARRKTQG